MSTNHSFEMFSIIFAHWLGCIHTINILVYLAPSQDFSYF